MAMKQVVILLVVLVGVVSGEININFANMFEGSSLLKPPPCTNITCKPYLSLRQALNAAHTRAAAKGLWAKSFLKNPIWPGFSYDGSCNADAPIEFPPKEGAFAELLNRGIRYGYSRDSGLLFNATTNPPTGAKIDYYNAILDELKAFYGPIKTSWVLFNFSEVYDVLQRKEVDWFVSAGFDTSARTKDPVVGIGCTLFVQMSMMVVRSNDKYKTFVDLLAAGKDLKLGTYSGSFPNKALSLDPTLVFFSDDLSFTDQMKMLIDGKIDALYDGDVMAVDVEGTPWKLDQFLNIISPLGVPRQIVTPLD